MNILAIIPARGGSKGIPGKNMTMCGGKPLVEWSITAGNESTMVNEVFISTDDNQILMNYASTVNIDFFDAPISDVAQIEDRLDGLISTKKPDIIVLLQPTSPVRTGKQIDEAIEQLQRDEDDSLLSVVRSHSLLMEPGPNNSVVSNYDFEDRPRRQEMRQFEENGSIYVFTREHWGKTNERLGGKIGLYEMPEECRIQIDSLFDLWMAEKILEYQLANV